MVMLLKRSGKLSGNVICIICIVVSCLIMSCASAEAAGQASFDFEGGEESSVSFERDGAERMIVYSVNIEIEVKKLDDARTAVMKEVDGVEGFIIRESPDHVTARVPEENLDFFLQNVRLLGKVKSENKTGRDISDRYRDDLIRLESMRNARNRYNELLEKAVTVSEMLEIEKELERINAEIEVLEGRKHYAELSVRYSAVTVMLEERSSPGPLGWIFFGLFTCIKWLFVW